MQPSKANVPHVKPPRQGSPIPLTGGLVLRPRSKYWKGMERKYFALLWQINIQRIWVIAATATVAAIGFTAPNTQYGRRYKSRTSSRQCTEQRCSRE